MLGPVDPRPTSSFLSSVHQDLLKLQLSAGANLVDCPLHLCVPIRLPLLRGLTNTGVGSRALPVCCDPPDDFVLTKDTCVITPDMFVVAPVRLIINQLIQVTLRFEHKRPVHHVIPPLCSISARLVA